MEPETVLQLKQLKVYFKAPKKKGRGNIVHAVDGVDLSLKKGEIFGLVGESGCGKSTLGKAILKLIPLAGGELFLKGKDISAASHQELIPVRPMVQMIFQDPYASLDPRMTVFETLAEPLLFHKRATKKTVAAFVFRLMKEVGLAARFAHKYPHEFSGGQRQRLAIARALSLDPELVIADEPVSALDVSIQSQILNLLLSLTSSRGLSLMFISHDLSVVKYIANRVAVMYLGRIVESGDTENVFKTPLHPYTQALLSAVPLPDPDKEKKRFPILLEGDPPSPISIPSGCRFHTRCPYAFERCFVEDPKYYSGLTGDQKAACFLVEDLKGENKKTPVLDKQGF